MAPDGRFVVTWTTSNGAPFPDADMEVVARRFDAAGVPQGPEFAVNTSTTRNQYDPSVGIDDTGNFVVIWNSFTHTMQGTFGQRFDASGLRRGGEFLVRDSAVGSGGTHAPAVAVAPTGEYLVVWQEHVGGPGSSNVIGQRFAAAGDPVGAAFRINDATNSSARLPTVDVDGSGNFVVVWHADFFPGRLLLGRRLAANGTPLGAEFQVNANSGGYPSVPAVASGRDGSFVVAWQLQSPSGILARRFDASGMPVGGDLTVGPSGQRPAIDVDADGDFAVAWSGPNGSAADVFGARFQSSGIPAGPTFRVNSYTTGAQAFPRIASDPAGNFVVAWLSEAQNGVDGVFAQRYAGGLSAAALGIDALAGPTSDGNDVFEGGETVAVTPSWLNANVGAETFTGTGSSFTGPGAPGDPTYTIADGAASYGTVASNAVGTCGATSDCYALGLSVPSTRPALHWDATFDEVISPANLGAAKNWTLHVGDSFTDVPRASGFYRFVESLLHHSVTGGCSATQYCPSASTTREQMAVFVLVAKDGPGNVPPSCGAPMFNDVPAGSPFCPWIEELARRGVVAGCGGGNYCPDAAVSREQMALFVLLTKEPGVTPPACGTPMFNDVPASSPFCSWIEELARRGVVTGCGGGNYCPAAPVTREQMAVFISATFGLQLYGP